MRSESRSNCEGNTGAEPLRLDARRAGAGTLTAVVSGPAGRDRDCRCIPQRATGNRVSGICGIRADREHCQVPREGDWGGGRTQAIHGGLTGWGPVGSGGAVLHGRHPSRNGAQLDAIVSDWRLSKPPRRALRGDPSGRCNPPTQAGYPSIEVIARENATDVTEAEDSR